jgi:DNA end-binding protein Ku
MTRNLGDLDLADRYQDALREVIDAKSAGRQVVAAPEEVKVVVDIMDALRQSIEATKAQKKPMEKARGTAAATVEAKPEAKPARPRKKAA